MSSPGHEWAPHEREGWSVCSRCGMVRNYDRETTTCSGALPKIRPKRDADIILSDAIDELAAARRVVESARQYRQALVECGPGKGWARWAYAHVCRAREELDQALAAYDEAAKERG